MNERKKKLWVQGLVGVILKALGAFGHIKVSYANYGDPDGRSVIRQKLPLAIP